MSEKNQLNHLYRNANLGSHLYAKVCLGIPPSRLEQAKKGLRGVDKKKKDKYWMTIFKDHESKNQGDIQDDKRFQGKQDIRSEGIPGWWKYIEKKVQEQLDIVYPDLQLELVTVLKSLPGGVQQSWHADFSVFNFPRFAGLISFDDETKLIIKNNGNEGDRGLRILEGEMVIFRGDLVHAGAAYEKENRRIYFKAIPVGCELYESEKNAVAYGRVCEEADGGCGKKFKFQTQLYSHQERCVNWQKVVEEKKKKCKCKKQRTE